MNTPPANTFSLKPIVIGALALILCALLLLKPPFVVRPLSGKSAAGTAPTPSAAAGFVDPVWNAKILPAFMLNAVDAREIFAALQADPEAAGAKYGRRESNNPYNYLVKGAGTVTAVNTKSRAGTLAVHMENRDILLQIGPVVTGTAVRDATGLVSFNQFTNQLDYADVSKEMNTRAVKAALAGRQAESFLGRAISFTGSFTYDPKGAGPIKITPVKIDLQP